MKDGRSQNQEFLFKPPEYFKVSEIDYFPGLRLEISDTLAQSEIDAWELSLKKWDLLHRLCKEGKLIADGGVKTCGLCSLYYYGHDEECEDCPIKEAGHPGCENTPQKDYESAIKKGDLICAEQAANDELQFLKRIRYESGL